MFKQAQTSALALPQQQQHPLRLLQQQQYISNCFIFSACLHKLTSLNLLKKVLQLLMLYHLQSQINICCQRERKRGKKGKRRIFSANLFLFHMFFLLSKMKLSFFYVANVVKHLWKCQEYLLLYCYENARNIFAICTTLSSLFSHICTNSSNLFILLFPLILQSNNKLFSSCLFLRASHIFVRTQPLNFIA